MAKLPVFDINNKETGDIELDDQVWNVEENQTLVWQVIKAYLSNQRQGTSCTKNRKYVQGGGAKPYRQKGTGRARQGTSRSPLKRGGGTIFGPNPRSFHQKVNIKAGRNALKVVLSDKVRTNRLTVVDEFKFEEFKTKQVVKMLDAFKAKKVLIIDKDQNNYLYFSARNIPNVDFVSADNLNVYQALRFDKILLSKSSVELIEKRFRKG